MLGSGFERSELAALAEPLDDAERHRLHHRAATLIGSDPERVGEAAHHLLRASPEHREDAVAMSRRAGALRSAC